MARFCMVTTFYPPYSFGGDGVFVEALSRGLAGRGHEVDVVHCVDSYRALSPRKEVVEKASPPGVTVHGLRSRAGVLSPLATHQLGAPLLKARALRRILASKPFDVVHFHNVSLVGGPRVLAYGPRAALKVYTLHEHWLLCPMHTLFRDNREVCTRKRCVACSLHYKRPPQWWRYGRLLEKSVSYVDRFLAPTEFTRRIHLDSGLPMKISVLGPFHEPGPVSLDEARERPFFLYAGRLEKLKGVHTLLDAFRGDGEVDLLIAGEGSEAGDLKARARVCERVRFLGHVPRERLAGLMAKALAVVVPSIGHEVFPLVVLESFAAGTPIVARAVGSLEEIVTSSGGGLLFRDPAELVAALRRLEVDAPYRRELGRRGHEAWRANGTLDIHMGRYLSLLEEVRETRRAPGAR